MPVSHISSSELVPELHHVTLDTVFRGIEHPISTPEAPIHQYRGIKYASVPGRFHQSKLFASYPPLVDASKYGPICPQIKNMNSFEEIMFGLSEDEIPKQVLKQNEFECLNLNITCPAGLTSHSHLPVMVWVHGGGDRGHGSSWVYDAGPLVRKSILLGKPVIVVNFNFRLGLFGFAAGPQLREDNRAAGEEGVGNYGLRDQRKLLEWLHYYIADFGGDPRNIILFGESTGAFDIICHLLSSANETRPLFHRAIVQSAVIDYNLPDVAAAGWQMSRLMSTLHVSTIDQLRSLDAEQLVKFGQTLRAVDDGVFLRHGWKDCFLPENAHRHAHHSHHHLGLKSSTPTPTSSKPHSRPRPSSSTPSVTLHIPAHLQPLIIGDCASDSLLWSTPISYWSSSGVARRLKAICQSLSKASGLLHAYDISAYTPDDEIADRVLELVNDARVAWPTECFVEHARAERRASAGGAGVWRYVFDQDGALRGMPHHAADLMYLFDNVPLPDSSSTQSIAGSEVDMFPESFSDDEDEDVEMKFSSVIHGDNDGIGIGIDDIAEMGYNSSASSSSGDGMYRDDAWGCSPSVDVWSYSRVRDTMQEKWLAFANGETPWSEEKVFVFGPEGETGERSRSIFEGRRRKRMWKEALEPLGMALVQKIGVELSRGPPLRG